MNEKIIENLPEIITTTGSGLAIIDFCLKKVPDHVKERLRRSLERMSEYINEKNQSEDPGDTWRNDWFSENQVSGHRVPRRLFEKTINGIIDDSAERKSDYVAKFWVNVCLTSNADIDKDTAFSYFETIETLSWRQLCIIRLIVLCRDGEVDTEQIDHREQIHPSDLTNFYAIGRDFQHLIDNHYVSAASIPRYSDIGEVSLRSPGNGQLQGYTERLHSLMNLDEIPITEIEEMFSIWNVKRKEADFTP